MKASIVRWFILLVALLCAVQAASAFNIKTETINPATGSLEPGQQVTARCVLTYDMATTDDLTGLNNRRYIREFARQIKRMADAGITVVLLVGNHDVPLDDKRASSVDIFRTLDVPNVIVGGGSRSGAWRVLCLRQPQFWRAGDNHGTSVGRAF